MSDLTNNNNYSSQNIRVLKGLEAVRVRPGMYIGNTDDGSGLHHMVYEVTDNSVDEALAGYCKNIQIIMHTDGSVSVADDGRGVPVDIHESEGVSAAQVIMTQLHAGGKFDQDTYQISGGLHGVGVSVVNALSVWLELVVVRNGKYYFMRFRQGDPEAPLKEIQLNEYLSEGQLSEMVMRELRNKKSGTYIRFLPDNTIFTSCDFNVNILSTRYRELSFLNPGLRFELYDQEKDQMTVFFDQGGVTSFVLNNARNKTLLFPQPFSCTLKKEGITVDIGLVWCTNAYDDNTICFTNNIPQKEGGTHLQGFRTGLTKAVQKFIPENKLKGMVCVGEDIREGLFTVLSVKVPNPRFASQTKEKLVSTEVRAVVEQVIVESLSRFLEENPTYTKMIVERILESMRAREAAKRARELSRKTKQVDYSISVAGKLADCTQKDPRLRELFVVEGQSAGGTAKMARNNANQAVLALQGKILNVEKAILNKVLQYEAIRTLIAVLGVGLEKDCFPEDCKYHKIILMTDADVDGSHIRTLILTFLIRYMRPIIDAGYVYISRPPLYGIKNKKHPTIYLRDDQELQQYIISATRKLVHIYQDNVEILDDKKADFYQNAFQAKQELLQFGSLSALALESKLALTQLTLIDFENFIEFLSKRYTDCKVEELDVMKYKINYTENAKQKNFIMTAKPLSDNSKTFIKACTNVKLKVHSKEYTIDTVLDFNNLITKIQSDLFEISRFKGLGEMNPKELRETAIFPASRIIKQVNITDFEQTDYMVKLLMGTDVPLRREFIETNALEAKVDA